ncbi:MAG: SRPBCC domain-containing protein [Actinomycetota bacterium]
MSDTERSLEFEIEVAGTPEEVWQAVATGPGITSWYVPHRVEEKEGGHAVARFGPGPEMEVPGRVAAWEPPNRIVFDGGEGVDGLAFEWVVEAAGGGHCVVRLINSGFGVGDPWDDLYDGMSEGWRMFLLNLQLHRRHFPGQTATPMLPTASLAGPRDRAWKELLGALGQDEQPTVGDRIELGGDDGELPRFAGEVVDVATHRIALVLDAPAPATAFIAAEGRPGAPHIEGSIWSYLYGPDQEAIAERDEPRWAAWLAARAVDPEAPPTA